MENNDLNAAGKRILEAAQQLLQEKDHILIALEGRCASGKTTLASYLKETLSCELIHMDDFFLRPEQRTKERLATPGGNVDYERFIKEVMEPLQSHIDFSYRPYDCHTGSLKEPVRIAENPVTIIEGAYSCHPQLWEYYDLHVFLDVEKPIQRERILARNGSRGMENFILKWIPLEEAYFETYNIKEKCEMCL